MRKPAALATSQLQTLKTRTTAHALTAAAVVALALTASLATSRASQANAAVDPASVTVYAVAHPHGLMVTSGGWAYCLQVQTLARRTGYTLLCGRYVRDGYTGYGLRSRRHLDWGNPAYLASLGAKVAALHRLVGGKLVLIGVSYSGFGVATLAAHHPELRPDRLIVIDSFLNLIERRNALLPSDSAAHDIDAELRIAGGTLAQRTVTAAGLARLVAEGTALTIIWSVARSEQREFKGATCNLASNAGVLADLANLTGKPVFGWVTHAKHGYDLWDRGKAIMAGRPPGQRFTFVPHVPVPTGAFCR